MRPELLGLPDPQWFHHGAQILALLETYRPIVCVELGTNTGGSAIATARAISRWNGRLTCVDAWNADVPLHECLDNFIAAKVDVFAMQGDTVAMAKVWRGPIDYLYVDAGHSYAECKADLEAWWPFLLVGGLIAGDDYDDPHGDANAGVTAAWDDFERERGQAFNRTVSDELIGCQCERCQRSRLIWGIKR